MLGKMVAICTCDKCLVGERGEICNIYVKVTHVIFM